MTGRLGGRPPVSGRTFAVERTNRSLFGFSVFFADFFAGDGRGGVPRGRGERVKISSVGGGHGGAPSL